MRSDQIVFRTARGEEKKLSDYSGKVLLIVNIASGCGYTPQLESLERIYQEYQKRGLEILAFPTNDFNQEPLDTSGTESFCKINYGVTFQIMEKCHVKGKEQHPLFHFLSHIRENGRSPFPPFWNFHKYLLDKNGRVRDYFITPTKPDSKKVRRAIEKLL